MKKYILILLTIALIFLVEIKAQNTSGDGDGSGDDTNNTNGTNNTNSTDNKTKDNGTEGNATTDPTEEKLNKTESKAPGDPTAGGLNPDDPEGIRMHINVLEGFSGTSKIKFNLFGKKYYTYSIIKIIMKIFNTRLRSRLRMRNLAGQNEADCVTDESQLLAGIKSIKGDEKESIKALNETRDSMLQCDGNVDTTENLGVDWDDSTTKSSVIPDLALKNDKNIADHTGSDYLNLLTKAIGKDIKYIHVFGLGDSGSASKEFEVKSFYADTIRGGDSVITSREAELKDVDFGSTKCSFDKVDAGGKMTCEQSVAATDLKTGNDVYVPGSSEKELIYLNFVKSESSGSGDSNRKYPDKSGSGLSTGGIVAIVIVCVVIVVAIAAISFMLKKKPSIPDENDFSNAVDSQARVAPVQ